MMQRGTLRHCPECRQPWPQGAENDLRSFAWLNDLPRNVSVSNIDAIIHDGAQDRNRFLVLETKRPDEPQQTGQNWLLTALARFSPITVRVLRGTMASLSGHVVTRDGVNPTAYATTPALFRDAVALWLSGGQWVDPRVARPSVRAPDTGNLVDDLMTELRW